MPGLGLGTIAHAEPFHDSTNVAAAEPMSESPTATHDDTLTHDTDRKISRFVPAFGLGTAAHTEPFHDSTNVTYAEPIWEIPTATHDDALTHETESS